MAFKQFYGTIIGSRQSQWLARLVQFVNKWCCNSCEYHAIPGPYYMMVASIIDNIHMLSMVLLACLLLLCLSYGHKTVRNYVAV